MAATTLIAAGMPGTQTFLPYLVVPSFAAGFGLGMAPAVGIGLTSLFTFAVVRAVSNDAGAPAEVIMVVEWLGMAVTAGLMSGWARTLLQEERRTTTSYAAAHQLLTELRDVSRELPTGLDEVSLAQEVIASVDDELEFDRGAVYSRDENEIITPLAYRGADRLDWNPKSGDELWTMAFQASTPLQRDRAISADRQGYSAFFPIRLAERTIGMVAVERDLSPWTHRDLLTAQSVIDDAALRIETGQLFSEVRSIATVEERRRLAREIHDGIAQEIASLGYVVDDLSARSVDVEISADLQTLRGELSRIVSELRLSIFDLRTDVQPSTGLGAALSSYVRSMSTGSGITMHMILDESSLRLPIEAETEVLRIAQEAITNARKHARARNLWVTCRVDPPKAFLRIADDGRGLGSPRGDSYGLEIMRERALRINADLAVRQRVGGGTVVELNLGGPLTTDSPVTVHLETSAKGETP
jgi:signal transduction histidine kinase